MALSTRKLKLEQDRLWADHYYLTRQVIRDAVNKDPCLDVDLKALYQNQKDLGRNFGNLTGNKKTGDKLANALKYHIETAVEIVTAAIQGKSIDDLYKEWQQNATEIAQIYHRYNPSIDLKEMNRMMQEHLSTTLAEAVAIVKKDCAASQAKGKIALEHVRMMSSYINANF